MKEMRPERSLEGIKKGKPTMQMETLELK